MVEATARPRAWEKGELFEAITAFAGLFGGTGWRGLFRAAGRRGAGGGNDAGLVLSMVCGVFGMPRPHDLHCSEFVTNGQGGILRAWGKDATILAQRCRDAERTNEIEYDPGISGPINRPFGT
jgi:hypothetical protein